MADEQTDDYQVNRFHPARLFLERILAYWTSIWKCWRIVFDGTVALYILLPGLWIFGGMYRDLLRNPPEWLMDVPIVMGLATLGVIQLMGTFRTFAEQGDGLFLHRSNRWNRGMLAASFMYGFMTRLVIAFAYLTLLAPLLLQVFQLDVSSLMVIIVISAGYGFVWMLIKDLWTHRYKGWRRTLLLSLTRMAFIALFVGLVTTMEREDYTLLGAGCVLMILLGAWLMRLRSRATGTLMHEISVENAAYVASVSWILMEALEKKSVPKLRKPLLFKQSKPLLKHRDDSSRLLDSWFKSLLRRLDLLKPLLYLTFLGSTAIVLTPLGLALILWLVLPILLVATLQRQWLQWLSEPYLALFKWDEQILEQASIKAKIWSSIPSAIVWSVVVGIKAGLQFGGFAWSGIVILPFLGYYWLKLLNEIVASFHVKRRHRE